MNDLAHAVFGNGADGRSGYLEGNPLPGFRNVKLLELQIRIEPTLGLTLEWETWLPLMARFPVKSQTLDMGRFFGVLDFGGYFWGDDFLIR